MFQQVFGDESRSLAWPGVGSDLELIMLHTHRTSIDILVV